MTKLVITIAALAAMNAGRAHCQTTVDQWIALCLKGPSTAEHASCESYVRGVADALLSIQATRCWTKGPGVAPPATLLMTKSSSDDAGSRQKSLNRFGAKAVYTAAILLQKHVSSDLSSPAST